MGNVPWCLVAVGLMLPQAVLQAVPFTNGGAETGDLSGWSASSTTVVGAVQTVVQQSGTVNPFEGEWFFNLANNPASSAWMAQTGTLGLENGQLRLAGVVQTENMTLDDYGEAVLSIFDGTGQLLTSASSGSLTTETFVWEPFGVVLDVPPDAAYWQVELKGTLAAGVYVNVFYDAISIPELGTLSLLGAGGLALMRRRRA